MSTWLQAMLQGIEADGWRCEIVGGTLSLLPLRSPAASRYASRLCVALGGWTEEQRLGETLPASGFVLQEEPLTLRAPDLAFVRTERLPVGEDEAGFWHLAPDLAVEIISPSETAQSIEGKVQDYLTAGTRLVWLLFPALRVVVEHRPDGSARRYSDDQSLDGGDVVPGFTLPLAHLFR